MKQSKKKRSRAPKQVGENDAKLQNDNEEQKAMSSLTEDFSSLSIQEASSAYTEVKGEPDTALGIMDGCAAVTEEQAISCSSPNGSTSLASSKLFRRHGRSKKKVIAATGTVSTVLGKQYVTSNPRKDSLKPEWSANRAVSKEESEQFLCSMLGDESELSMAVVRDVLCQCGYEREKALNALLELSASSYKQSKSGGSLYLTANTKEDFEFYLKGSDYLNDRACDSTSYSSESESQDSVWFWGQHSRNYSEVLTHSEYHSPTRPKNSNVDLPKMVLESLFNMPKSSEHEPITMNWKDVVKKMECLGQKDGSYPVDSAEPHQLSHARGDEYHMYRKAAKEHWDAMKSCYQKAATTFSNGERQYAGYLSEQGRLHNKMARKADEKASQQIFDSRNKRIENVITIDLHGQHVKPAVRLLKLHLLFGAYVRSVQTFRVITGCGNHGVGKSKLKQSVINLVKREGIKWSEENQGTIIIRLDGHGHTEFSFLESESDDE